METLDYAEITKDLHTKSEKIRVLGRKGVPTAEIARFLGIRYQHARNVLVDAGVHGGMAEAAPQPIVPKQRGLETNVAPPSGLPVSASTWVDLDAAGRLQIPAHLMAQLEVGPGSSLYVSVSEDGLELLSRRGAIKRAQRIAAKYKRPGVSEVDVFLEDKRKEAREDDARWQQEHATWAK
jgi:antitoxin component of MazEF toxin-antitoxin module